MLEDVDLNSWREITATMSKPAPYCHQPLVVKRRQSIESSRAGKLAPCGDRKTPNLTCVLHSEDNAQNDSQTTQQKRRPRATSAALICWYAPLRTTFTHSGTKLLPRER